MTLAGFFAVVEEDTRFAYTVDFPDGGQSTAYNYHRQAQEMLAWSRWQLGWLSSDRVRCMTNDSSTVELSPIAAPGNGIAMVAVPLSETELIVIESRQKIGYDASQESRWPDGARATMPVLLHEGVLVYTVDSTLPGGQLPLKVAGDSGNRTVKDYPLLAPGQSITIRGYTITVRSADRLTHTVHISKEAS